MLVIGFFRDLLSNLGSLVAFVVEPNDTLTELFGTPTNILSILSVGLASFLGIVLILHVAHLINVIAG